MNKFYCVLILSLVLSLSKANGQCNIEKDDKSKDIVTYTAGSEELYRNIDLENGLNSLSANFVLITQKEDKNKIKFYLVVTHKKSSYQSVVVPRSLTINFTNGESLILNADDMTDPIAKGSVIVNICYYRITLDKIEKIRANPIKMLLVSDTRSGEKLSAQPYSNVFVEQINCLYKKSTE